MNPREQIRSLHAYTDPESPPDLAGCYVYVVSLWIIRYVCRTTQARKKTTTPRIQAITQKIMPV